MLLCLFAGEFVVLAADGEVVLVFGLGGLQIGLYARDGGVKILLRPDFDSQKHPPLQPFEYPPVIKSEIFQGESLHFGYLCEHVYPQAQKQIGHGQRGRGGQEFGEVP